MIETFGEIMAEAYNRGWITSRDGNISLKNKDSFYITPSGVKKQDIKTEDILEYPVQNNIVMNEFDHDTKPSIEMDMHILVQSSHMLTKAVVHLHPTNTIALMRKKEFDAFALQNISNQFPELRRYTKVGPTAPFNEPGSNELAYGVYSAMSPGGVLSYDIVGLDRHGVVAAANDAWQAFEHVERLEHICEIALKAGL